MIKVAVAGAGYWGRNLVRNFDEIGSLHTICDSDQEILDSYKEEYAGKRFVNSYQKVLGGPEIDAIVIATPAETHFEMAKLAMLSGKHVFVEKPLALHANEAEELHKLSISQDLRLMVGHILLYHPAIIALKGIINTGELGKINYIYSNRLNLGKVRSEENILWSFAPHDISVILYLLDEMPTQVIAQGGNYLNQNIADVTISVLSFKGGVKSHIFVSWLHPSKEQKLVVVGDKKMAVFDDTLEDGKLQIHDKGIDWVKRQPVPRKNGATIVPTQLNEPLKAECQHFIDCIGSGARPKTDGLNGVKVLKVLNACQNSLEQNGKTVFLDIQRQRDAQLPREQDSNDLIRSYSNVNILQQNGFKQNDLLTCETAIVDPDCRIGEGTKILQYSRIMSDVQIGNNCDIGQNVLVASGSKIGHNVRIHDNVSLCANVIFEDNVVCGHSVSIDTLSGPRRKGLKTEILKETRIKKGVTIGANSTIACGASIGKYAFIGAGALVKEDVIDHALVLGSPANIAGWVCKCSNRLIFSNGVAVCNNCNKQYRKIGRGIKCVGCNCGNNRGLYNDDEICNDCKIQLNYNKEQSEEYIEEEALFQQVVNV